MVAVESSDNSSMHSEILHPAAGLLHVSLNTIFFVFESMTVIEIWSEAPVLFKHRPSRRLRFLLR